MLISKSLLNTYLSEFDKVKEVDFIDACNNLCMEVERIITHPFTDNLVVGKVLEVNDVVGSKKLHFAKVQISENTILEIVCGAPNLKQHQLVVVAKENTKLYDGRIIEAREMMGLTSHGMICAYSELTPNFNDLCSDEDKNGIIVLNSSLKIGDDACAIHRALGLDDTIYELSFPTNREDYASALIVMRDLANYLNLKFKKLSLIPTKVNSLYQIKSECSDITFVNTAIIDYSTRANTTWLKKSLLLNNDCSITNKIIDKITWASNLTGVAPLLFDTDKLPNQLVIKPANKNDKVVINNKTYILNNNEIVIKNNNEIVAVDGVAVADPYKISSETQKITLLFTDLPNSYKRKAFIKNNIPSSIGKYIKYQITDYQANLFVNELARLDNSLVSCFKHSLDLKTKIISFDLKECNSFLGIEINKVTAKKLFKKVGLVYQKNFVSVPEYRTDLENKYDLYEEILKAYGINNLPAVAPSSNVLMNEEKYNEHFFIEKLRNLLINHSFTEVKTYNLTSKDKLDKFNIYGYKPMYKVNPCSNSSHEFLRLSLINEMLEVMSYNANHKNDLQPIFEIQKIYTEQNHFNLTLITPEKIWLDEINGSYVNLNTFGLKAILKQIEIIFNISLQLEKIKSEYLYDSDSLAIKCEDRIIGYVGAIKQNLLKTYKLNEQIYLLTLNFEELIHNYKSTSIKVKPILDVPHSIKDITFAATKDTKLVSINNELNKLEFVSKYQYIKAYHMQDDKIAYSIRFYLINKNGKSLTKEEIEQYIKQITNIIENHL